MSIRTILLSAIILVSPLFFREPAAEPVIPGDPTIADLSFLSGDWSLTNEKTEVEEHWTAAKAKTMIGMGRTIANDRTVMFEYLRIEERKDGVYYVAQPRGGPAVAFKLTSVAKEKAVFENPKHDFPKMIRYEKNAAGHLVATVSGGADAKEPAETFDYAPMK